MRKRDIVKRLLCMACAVAVAGCGSSNEDEASAEKKHVEAERVALEFRLVEPVPGEGLVEMAMSAWGQSETFYAHEQALLTGEDVESATAVRMNGRPAVELKFTEAGAARLAEVTGSNVGRRMGMILNGELVTAPVIRDRISGGVAVINGEFTQEEAERVAAGLGR